MTAVDAAPRSTDRRRMINALRALGFDYVFDTNMAAGVAAAAAAAAAGDDSHASADVTIMEEASELVERLGGKGGPLPVRATAADAHAREQTQSRRRRDSCSRRVARDG